MQSGYTGISFPFRIGVKGGIVMSSTSLYSVPHIEESIQQILGTRLRERVMELYFGSDVDSQIFEPNDLTTHTLIKYEIVEALTKFEPRIKVEEKDLILHSENEKLYVELTYEVVSYGLSYSSKIYVGEVEVIAHEI